jgi:hypothetical protein
VNVYSVKIGRRAPKQYTAASLGAAVERALGSMDLDHGDVIEIRVSRKD